MVETHLIVQLNFKNWALKHVGWMCCVVRNVEKHSNYTEWQKHALLIKLATLSESIHVNRLINLDCFER